MCDENTAFPSVVALIQKLFWNQISTKLWINAFWVCTRIMNFGDTTELTQPLLFDILFSSNPDEFDLGYFMNGNDELNTFEILHVIWRINQNKSRVR